MAIRPLTVAGPVDKLMLLSIRQWGNVAKSLGLQSTTNVTSCVASETVLIMRVYNLAYS